MLGSTMSHAHQARNVQGWKGLHIIHNLLLKLKKITYKYAASFCQNIQQKCH